MNGIDASRQPAMPSTVAFLIDLFSKTLEENDLRDKTGLSAAALTEATSIEEAGLDSFDFVEAIFKIEEHFGVEIDYNANSRETDLKTIGDLARQIDRLVARKQPA